MYKGLMLLLASALLVSVGCSNSEEGEKASSSTSQSIVQTESGIFADVGNTLDLGDAIVMSPTDEHISTIVWQVVSESGTDVAGANCLVLLESISCAFDEPGLYEVSYKATFPNGTTENRGPFVVEVLDAALRNQAPVISCIISQNNKELRRIHTISDNDKNMGSLYEDTAYQLDCGSTSDEDTVNQLKFEIKYAALDAYTPISSSSSINFVEAGPKEVSIRVTDTEGTSAIKDFIVFVLCKENKYEPLKINPGLVTVLPAVSGGQNLNKFNYGAKDAVTGGSGEYRYSWDFNGDGIFDRMGRTFFTSRSTVNGRFSAFGGNRNIKLRVVDNMCGSTTEVTVNRNLEMFRMTNINNKGPLAGKRFVQADLKASDNNPSATGKFLMADYGPKFSCAYVHPNTAYPGYFSMTAEYTYGGPKRHGMSFSIRNIMDKGDFEKTHTNVLFWGGRYYTDEQEDDSGGDSYYGRQKCAATIKITRKKALEYCDYSNVDPEKYYIPRNGNTIIKATDSVIVEGTFDCGPVFMKNGGGVTMSAKSGFFHCQASAKRQPCPMNRIPTGGARRGGGNPPTPE